MTDCSSAIVALDAVTAILSAAVVYVLAQPTDLPLIKKVKVPVLTISIDVSCKELRTIADSNYGLQINGTWLERADVGFDDSQFLGGIVGRFLSAEAKRMIRAQALQANRL